MVIVCPSNAEYGLVELDQEENDFKAEHAEYDTGKFFCRFLVIFEWD